MSARCLSPVGDIGHMFSCVTDTIQFHQSYWTSCKHIWEVNMSDIEALVLAMLLSVLITSMIIIAAVFIYFALGGV